MDGRLRSVLVVHGAVVILLGLIAGIPYGMVVIGSMEGEARAWSMAHLEGLLNGMLVIVVGAAGDRVALGPGAQTALVWSMIGMAYGNVVASIIGALFGVRGLTPAGPVANLVMYTLFMAAMVGVFVGVALLAWGARVKARQDERP